MSHITKVKTEIHDRDVLLQTLKELGHLYEEDRELQVEGTRLVMDVAVLGRRGFRVGFQRDNENRPYKMYFLHVASKEHKAFQDAVMQGYARRKIVKEARRRNYIVASEKVCSGNRLRLVLRKAV